MEYAEVGGFKMQYPTHPMNNTTGGKPYTGKMTPDPRQAPFVFDRNQVKSPRYPMLTTMKPKGLPRIK